MKKNIVCYSLGKIEPRKRLKFNQGLYGYTDRSNHGHYVYERRGLLTKEDYEKPLDSILILPTNITPKVLGYLKKFKAKYINYPLRG